MSNTSPFHGQNQYPMKSLLPWIAFLVVVNCGPAAEVTTSTNFGADNVLVKTDGIGTEVQATGITVDDSNNITGVNNVTAGTLTVGAVSGVFGPSNGGTGHNSFTKGDIIVATGSTTLGKLGAGTNGQSLVSDDSTSTGLAWSSPMLNLPAGVAILWPASLSGSIPAGWTTAGSAGSPPFASPDPSYIAIAKMSGTVASPAFSPPSGMVVAGTSITLTTTTAGATIRYTTGDGNQSVPTRTSGTVYASPIPITADATIKAIAYKDYSFDSAFSNAAYAIDSLPVVTGASVAANGVNFSIALSEAVTVGPSFDTFTSTLSGGAVTLTYVSGSGTDSLVYELSRTVTSIETGTLTYSGNAIADSANQALAAFSGFLIANGSTVSGAPSYLVAEDFEETGTPAGWTVSAGSPNFNYAVTVLEGTESARNGSNSDACHVTFAADTTIEAYARIRVTALPGSAANYLTLETATGSATLLGFRIDVTGNIYAFANGSASSAAGSTISPNTTYHIWMRYVSGDTCSVAFSEDGIRPTSGNSFTSKIGASGSAGRLRITAQSGGPLIFDRVLVSAGSIPSNP